MECAWCCRARKDPAAYVTAKIAGLGAVHLFEKKWVVW